MSKGKVSTFLKGQKQKYSGRSEARVSARTLEGRRSDRPNSTKVGQGDGLLNRPFDVSAKRAEQADGAKNEPNGSRSKYDLMLKQREAKKAKSKKSRKKAKA